MSRYNLRARVETGPVDQPRVRPVVPLRSYSPSPVRDIPPHLVGSGLVAGRAPALYSQVAASRASSPPVRGVFSVTVPVVCPTGEPGDDRLISSPVDTIIRDYHG